MSTPQLPASLITDVNTALAGQDYVEALRLLDGLSEGESTATGGGQSVEVLTLKAGCFLRLHKAEEAEALVAQVLDQDPNNATALEYLNAISYSRRIDRVDRADELLRDGQEAEADPIYAELLAEVSSLQEDSSEDGAALLPPDFRFHLACNYSTCLVRLSRPEEALVQIDEALRLKPDWSDLFIPRAVVLRNLGRLEEALAAYDKALQIGACHYAASIGKAEALFNPELSRFEEGLAVLRPITSRRPLPSGHAHAFYLEAFGLLKLERYEAGVKSSEAALAFGDDTPETRALHSLALALKAQHQLSEGDLRGALSTYDRALTASSSPSIETLFNFGCALLKDGQVDRAESVLLRVLDQDPDHFYAQATLGLMQLQGQRYEEAIAFLAGAWHNKQCPAVDTVSRSEVLQNLSVACIRAQKLDDAAKWLEELLALDPSREVVKTTLEAVRHDLALHNALDTHLASRGGSGQPVGGESKGDVPPPPPPPPSVSPPAVMSGSSSTRPTFSAVPFTSPRFSYHASSSPASAPAAPSSPSATGSLDDLLRRRMASSPSSPLSPATRSSPASTTSSSLRGLLPATPAFVEPPTPMGPLPSFAYESLKAPGPYPEGVLSQHRELYLSDDDFKGLFHMGKDAFKAQPQWRQKKRKEELGLW